MIVISYSLDSTLEQAKLQGNLQAILRRYELFRTFDRVVLLTHDTQKIYNEVTKIVHVPCAYSKYHVARRILANCKPLWWFYFSLSSFFWMLSRFKQIKLVIGENVDSPTPLLFSLLFRVPYYIIYNYDVSAQVRGINKHLFEGTLLLALERLCFTKATRVWVTAISLIEKAKVFHSKRISLIPNWIDFNEKPKNQYGKLLEPRILFVGRLHPVKRVNLLIEAFKILTETHPHASLYIIGNGEEYHNLVSLTNKLKLNSCVRFLGFQSQKNVFENMRQSDMIVLPSIVEGNPRVLIEAMMLKVPIVATNVMGIRDIIKHDETGHLIDHITPNKLAKAIEHMFRNKTYAVTLADNAYEFAKQHFSKEQAFKKIRKDLFFDVPGYREKISSVIE